MTDFATDLLWEDEKQPLLPAPARPHDPQQDTKARTAIADAPAESQAERLQRIAGNAVLAWSGALGLKAGSLSPGDWFLFMQAVGYFWWPLMSIASFPVCGRRRCITTSGCEKTESRATTSAKPSWKAAWPGVEGSR